MCLSYCLMGNHVHLLIETREPNLGIGMHRLHGGYAQYFNRRHGFVGHLFQDRYEAVTIANDRAAVHDRGVHRAQPGRRPACARRRSNGHGAATPQLVEDRAPRGSTAARLGVLLRRHRRRGHHPLRGVSSTASRQPKRGQSLFRSGLWAGGGRAQEWAEEPEGCEEDRDGGRGGPDDPVVVDEVGDHRDREDDGDAEEDKAGDRVLVRGLDDVGAVGLVEAQAVGGARGDQADRGERGREQRRVEEASSGSR